MLIPLIRGEVSGFQNFLWKETVFLELDKVNKLCKFPKLIVVVFLKNCFDILRVLIRVITYRNS